MREFKLHVSYLLKAISPIIIDVSKKTKPNQNNKGYNLVSQNLEKYVSPKEER